MTQPDLSRPARSLDVIESVDYGYRTLWRERDYLLRLAAVPLAVKFICLMALVGLGWERDFIRSALVMLPSFFTEGWMLAHLVRLVFFDQRWPFQPTGNRERDAAMLEDRAYGITAGALFYVVTKFLLSGFLGLINQAQITTTGNLPVQGEIPPGVALTGFALLCLTLWGFRFIFLYVPAAAGVSLRVLTQMRQGLRLSLQILGTWLVCLVPFMMILLFAASIIVAPYAGAEGGLPAFVRGASIILQTITDTAVGIVSTAAIAYGLRKMIENAARAG